MIKKALTPLILTVSIFLISCGKEDPQDENITISQSAIEIDYEDIFRLDATFIRDGYSPSGFTWESANPNIATVRNDGTVTGQMVGRTIVTVYTADRLFSAECEVTVNPTNLLFREPLFDFGQNKAFIRANETRTVVNEDEATLLFQGENQALFAIAYLFPNTQYEFSIAYLNIESEAEVINLLEFLEQRYQYLGLDEDGFFIFENEEILMGLSGNDDGLFIIYLQNEAPSGAGNRVDRLREISNSSLMKRKW